VVGVKIFLSYGGRPSCTTPPGPRALCEVGLAAFCFAVRLSSGYRAPVPHPGLQWQGVKIIFLSCGGRPSCAPPPGPRALCEAGLAACFCFLIVFGLGYSRGGLGK
jgi:hypothetical protein